jgi:hypothetical protein
MSMNLKVDWANLSDESLEDRRKGTRVTLRYELEVSGRDSGGSSYKVHAFTRNISESGCCFEIARTVFAGETVYLNVLRKNRIGVTERTIPMRFRLVWVRQKGNMWIAGAMMLMPEDPWNVSFPPKIPATRPA